jgi:hypothetical protein
VASPTIELSIGVRQNSSFSHVSLAHGSDGFACPFDLAWSKAFLQTLIIYINLCTAEIHQFLV